MIIEATPELCAALTSTCSGAETEKGEGEEEEEEERGRRCGKSGGVEDEEAVPILRGE